MRHRLIGYARLSKTDGSQSLDLQRDALRAAGVDDAVNLYHDLASGVRDDRPGLDSCLRALRNSDVLVVWKLDRLGRNLAHLVNTVQDLSARGVGLRVLTGDGAQIDTTTAGPEGPRILKPEDRDAGRAKRRISPPPANNPLRASACFGPRSMTAADRIVARVAWLWPARRCSRLTGDYSRPAGPSAVLADDDPPKMLAAAARATRKPARVDSEASRRGERR